MLLPSKLERYIRFDGDASAQNDGRGFLDRYLFLAFICAKIYLLMNGNKGTHTEPISGYG